ncbi:MAG: hypothetical protein A2W05_08045 [Candidatus Schekmanbacteria bacterium RBG_16_38_10]|uniref:Sulfotransferase domain-containing protein n=1 Tax=Candidatus Schekmanbacteria bacterium RBG_16_38_10 TaxID=1817879 RepID=A0A1F7RQ49_9BACT|nr:MAG: hypothetical protein A2W05_08045 [Candidatus Schekmanbacteria bacterium RBG_16_38_10]
MMAHILGNHPKVYTLIHEIHFFDELIDIKNLNKDIPEREAIRIYAHLLSIINEGYLSKKNIKHYIPEAKQRSKGINKQTPANLYSDFLFYSTEKNKKKISCEQTPRYLFYLEQIFEISPDAKIVNMVRDPRDILLSQKNKWKLRFLGHRHIPLSESLRAWANYHPLLVSKLWNVAIKEAERFKRDNRVLTIRFEDLIDAPELTVKKVCDFAGIDYRIEMLEVPRVGSSFDRFDPEWRGIDSSKKQRWKKGELNNAEIYICQCLNREKLLRYGYEIESVSPNPLVLAWSFIILPFKIALAFLLNLKRFMNLKKVILKKLKS